MGYLELLCWRGFTPTKFPGLHESCKFSQEISKRVLIILQEQERLEKFLWKLEDISQLYIKDSCRCSRER